MDADAGPAVDEPSEGAEDTDPLPVPKLAGYPVAGSWVAAPPVPTTLPPYDFSALDMSRAPVGGRKRAALLGAGLLGAVAIVAGAVAVIGSDNDATDTGAAPVVVEPARDLAAESRLRTTVPADYPVATCATVDPPEGVRAQLKCTGDGAAGPAATFTLAANRGELLAAFDRLVQDSSVVVCPGRIQSPGPWRHNATPDLVSGTVFCAAATDGTLVGWTDEQNLLLSEVHAGPGDEQLTRLFAWWSAHS